MFNRQQSESERAAADYAKRPPPPSSKYPVLNFNNTIPYPAPQLRQSSVGGAFPVGPPPANPQPYHGVQSGALTPVNGYGPAPTAPTAPPIPPAYGQHQSEGQVSRASAQVPFHATPKVQRPQVDTVWQPPPPKVESQSGVRAQKKAIIIGCNYANTQFQLQGCIHDARNVEYMLQKHFGFRKENIRVLTDDGSGTAMPTRSNIFYYSQWLVKDLQPGDSLFFHFSGHGSQKPDFLGDERDGLNETLLPCDFQRAGEIIDDELNERLINPLPRGVYLHAVIDACHSGTAMDLEYYTKLKNGVIEWRSEGPTRKYKGTSGGIAVLFSACLDSEVAQDTDNLSGSVHTGAATHSLIEAIERHGRQLSYAQVLAHMHGTMDKLTGKPTQMGGIGGKIVDKLTNGLMMVLGIPNQTPQLSSNLRLNLNETLHI